MTADTDRLREDYSRRVSGARIGLDDALAAAADYQGVAVGAAVTEFIAAEAAARADYWQGKLAAVNGRPLDQLPLPFSPDATGTQPAVRGDQ